MKLEQTIIIERPVEEVFAYRSALQNAAEWHHDVVASELATPGAPGIGNRSTERRSGVNGVMEEWDLEITEFDRDRVLGILGRCGAVRVVERHVFAREDDHTRYTVCLEVTGSTLAYSIVQRKTVKTLTDLKSQLEAPAS